MGDKYTVYPEALKRRIENVDKMFSDEAKERDRWASLSPEQQEAETKRRELLDSWWNALSPEEKARIEALSPEDQEKEFNAVLERHGHEPIVQEIVHEPEPETLESLKAKLERAEQQLSTLKGKYEKEPAELQRQNNFLQEQIGLLQRQILDLQETVKPKVPEPKKMVFTELLKADIDELKTELAPEIADKIVKFNEKTFELGLKMGHEEAQRLISEVAVKFDGKLALSAKEKFDRDLSEAYPNWEIMWKTPEFQNFLQVIPPEDLSGLQRWVHIENAFKKLDSRTVIKAFDLFTGKKPQLKTETHIDETKLQNRVGAPRTSSPGGELTIQNKNNQNKISSQEAKKQLVALSTNYSRGLYRGSKEEYEKEYARLHALCGE